MSLRRCAAALFVAITLACSLSLAPMPAWSDAREGASVSGRAFEEHIQTLLEEKGYRIIPRRDWNEAILYREENPRIVVLDAPYRSIYGHRAHIEFLLIAGERQILIETKHQSSSGSVDEKLPYVYMNALANMPDREFVLVLSGDGWKDGAIEWAEARGADTEGFDVFRPEAFERWLEAEL